MRIAVLSDIHGNIDALEAVLSDSDKHHPDAYIFLGDLVFFGLYPQECFDALSKKKPILCIKGNTDANLEEVDTFKPSNAFEEQLLHSVVDCCDRLTTNAKVEIAKWPISHSFKVAGRKIDFCHGSPFSFSDKLTSKEQIDKTLAQKIAQERMDTICCGHTHSPADFMIDGTHIINVGAVGYSFDGDVRASYGMFEIEEGRISHQIIRVEYDRNRYLSELQLICDRLPLFKSIAYALEQGTPMPNWR